MVGKSVKAKVKHRYAIELCEMPFYIPMNQNLPSAHNIPMTKKTAEGRSIFPTFLTESKYL